MRAGIHPEYRPVIVEDASTGARFPTRSTAGSDRTVKLTDGGVYPLIVVDVTADSHPFRTGANGCSTPRAGVWSARPGPARI